MFDEVRYVRNGDAGYGRWDDYSEIDAVVAIRPDRDHLRYCKPASKLINAWHAGDLAGSSALLVRRHDGLDWAVLFNTDADRGGRRLADAIDGPIHRAVDGVEAWPEIDLFDRYL